MNKKSLAIFCILSFLSCNFPQKNTIKPDSLFNMEVQDLNEDKFLEIKASRINPNAEKYFKPIRYVQLESDTNMLIGEVSKIVLKDDRIYIMDQWSTSSVFVFDENGRFVNRISHKGQGPEEYIDMRDMFYDNFENTINILTYGGSGNRYKIMSYDRNGSKLVKQRFIDLKIERADRMRDGHYVFHSKNASNEPDITMNVSVYSETMLRLYDGLPIRAGWVNRLASGDRSLCRDKDDNIYCTSDYTTDVYMVTTDSLWHCYHYDFGKYNFPKDLNRPEIIEKMGRAHQLNDYVLDLEDFYKGENYVVSSVLFKGRYRIIIYDEETQTINSFIASGFKCFSDNNMVLSTPADTYTHLFTNPSIIGDEQTKELKKHFKYPLREEDNPILIIYEFK